MKAASQILVFVAALLSVLFVGTLLRTAYWQSGFYAERLLGGKPLPAVTQFFVDNDGLPFYLTVLPWFWLAGAPLLTRAAARDYWDPTAFVLRCLAFCFLEGLILLGLLTFLFLPYIGYYAVLQSSNKGWTEWTVKSCFLVLVIGFVGLGVWRMYQGRRSVGGRSSR